MARVKRGTTTNKRRKKFLKQTKGFRWGRKSKFKQAKEALLHAGTYAFRDRKNKKREFRKLWQIKIGAASKKEGISYSQLIHKLKQKNISLDRKILAELAENHPKEFKEIISIAKEE